MFGKKYNIYGPVDIVNNVILTFLNFLIYIVPVFKL